jgi:phospholipid/cholesterol/gamma-HCH transport system permease protein
MLGRLGRATLQTFASAGALSIFGGRALVDLVRPPFEFSEFAHQLHEIGWRSVPLIATSGLAIGIVLSMHTRATLERFGAVSMIPAGLGIALIRETGPLITGLLLSGRVGAGIGAEIGAMKVTEQIDALEATAVDAFRYLAVTRVLAAMIALPLLTTLMDFTGILGGYLAETVISGMSLRLYVQHAFDLIGFEDFVPATLKTVVFGFIIAVVAAHLGFTTDTGTEGVGRASTRAVVLASILIILSDVLLVRLIFSMFPTLNA